MTEETVNDALAELQEHGMKITPILCWEHGAAYRLSYEDRDGTEWHTECATLVDTYIKARRIINFYQTLGA
jgi:hypothetical protein